MAGNESLNTAARAKKDEFYTLLPDIERELKHYSNHFDGKTVLCNCDDPFESNFFKYFVLNFHKLHLRKLITTGYAGSPAAGKLLLSPFDKDSHDESLRNTAYMAEVTAVPDAAILNAPGYNTASPDEERKDSEDPPDDRRPAHRLDIDQLFRIDGNKLTELEGNGDFRSPECLKLMDEADIVVTNPPFSLFREYIAALMSHNKKFIIIGNQNAITYKEVFPLVMHNEMWLGTSYPKEFIIPENMEGRSNTYIKSDGTLMAKFGNVCWYTNLDLKKRHEKITLVKRYTPEEYPRYDNYKAVEVSRTSDIPCDYSGVMGVPISFMGKYNPDQFEIVGADEAEGTGFSNGLFTGGVKQCLVDGKRIYKRIFIRVRQGTRTKTENSGNKK
ncbi:MAG: adenine-specific methyltransferase EcoRI family protein [Eubacteriales bacterium]|nr:adenine-specific methyltransferase EcoRI family protein [Eubacteriales bacterium]